jgi:hypothetical protein
MKITIRYTTVWSGTYLPTFYGTCCLHIQLITWRWHSRLMWNIGNYLSDYTSASHSSRQNSTALVCKWTIPTKWPPLVSEVSANFCGQRVLRGQHNGSLRPYSLLSSLVYHFLFKVAPQLHSRGWMDPVPHTLLLKKSGSAMNRTRYIGKCSQELWLLDHRGGPFQ